VRTFLLGAASNSAWAVADSMQRLGMEFGSIDNRGNADSAFPGFTSSWPWGSWAAVVGPATPAIRFEATRIAMTHGAEEWPRVLDTSAVIGIRSAVEHGAYVAPLVSIGPNARIDCFVYINRNSAVSHHCEVGAFVSTGPGAMLCGGSQIGTGAFIGAGAVVLPGRTIGPMAVIGAGCVVTRDVPSRAVVVGNPARQVGESEDWVEEPLCPCC